MNSRELFQKWWEEFYETAPREPWDEIYSPEHDYFVDQDIDGQYDAWKASRAAIEIDVRPSPFYMLISDRPVTDHYQAGRNSVIHAIRAAGLRVKEK